MSTALHQVGQSHVGWNYQGIPLNPLEPIHAVIRHRVLIARLARREIESLHRGTILGFFWLAAQPLLLLAVYTFVFSIVFQSRGGGGDQPRTEYALTIFVGLILFNIFAETINRAPNLMRSNRTYVSQVVFPIEILPIISMVASLFQAAMSFVMLAVAYVILLGVPPLTAMMLPLVVLPLLFMTAGFSWFLASLGVFIRDIGPVIAVATRMLLFLCPIFYSLDMIPPPYRHWIMLNPLTIFVSAVRTCLFDGAWPSWIMVVTAVLGSMLTAWLGYAWFMKTRKGFADVL